MTSITNNIFKIISAVNQVAEAYSETQTEDATDDTYFQLYNAYGEGAGKVLRILLVIEWINMRKSNHNYSYHYWH